MNFKNVESASGSVLSDGSYLLPGMYMLTPTEISYGVSSQKGTPYMEVTFKCSSKNSLYNDKIAKAKFYITEKSKERLQYLHEGLYDVKISSEKEFKSEEDLVNYFKALIAKKVVSKPMVAGGSVSDDGSKIYSDLPYSGFFVPEDLYEEGAFEINGKRFQKSLTSTNKVYNPSATRSSNSSLKSNDDILTSSSPSSDGVDDLPF